MPAMRIDYVHLLDNEIKHYSNLDEVVEVCYPTGCVDMTKKEILTKMCEVEFKMTATWTHEFLEDLEGKWHKLSTAELARILVERLQEVYDWDEDVYYRLLA
jgi:hypothetical protein